MDYEKNMSFLVIPKSPKVFKKVEKVGLGFFNPNTIKSYKSYKNYLQNTQHIVLHKPHHEPRPRGHAARAFFLHPPFLPPPGDSFFRTFPTNSAKVLGLLYTAGLVYIPNTIKSYKTISKTCSTWCCTIDLPYL